MNRPPVVSAEEWTAARPGESVSRRPVLAESLLMTP